MVQYESPNEALKSLVAFLVKKGSGEKAQSYVAATNVEGAASMEDLRKKVLDQLESVKAQSITCDKVREWFDLGSPTPEELPEKMKASPSELYRTSLDENRQLRADKEELLTEKNSLIEAIEDLKHDLATAQNELNKMIRLVQEQAAAQASSDGNSSSDEPPVEIEQTEVETETPKKGKGRK